MGGNVERRRRAKSVDLVFPACLTAGALSIALVGINAGYQFAKADFVAISNRLGDPYEPPSWRRWMVHEPFRYSPEAAAYDSCVDLKNRFGVQTTVAEMSDGRTIPTAC